MENKNYFWRPVSEYTGGRVLATNGLDVLIGEINSDGDCESEEDRSTVLCGITGFIKIEEILPELKESEEDERIRKALLNEFIHLQSKGYKFAGLEGEEIIGWLEKQGDKLQKTSIWKHWKDGIAGNGNGEPIYLIKCGNAYSLSSCLGFECDYILLSDLDKCEQGEQKPQRMVSAEAKEAMYSKPEWSEEDEKIYQSIMDDTVQENQLNSKQINWLKDIKYRYFPQSKQEWSEEDEKILNSLISSLTRISASTRTDRQQIPRQHAVRRHEDTEP